ncbi:MAG: CRTAC1 family protein [Chloroflexota bacterium]
MSISWLFRQVCNLLVLSSVWLVGCQPLSGMPKQISAAQRDPSEMNRVSVEVLTSPFWAEKTSCFGQFITYTLDHVTMVPGGDTVRMFEANGGGVAINDLDGDGWLDIVLANHRDPNTILWNQTFAHDGRLNFKTERIGKGDARAVTLVDVDGDNLIDIAFSRRVSAPNFWRNLGDRRFEQVILDGISKPLYAINWGDLDQDGDLDLVGGTYDAGLLAEFGQEFLNGTDAGVYVYTQSGGRFQGSPLALNAQALALALVDFNGDHRLDVLVGNDFGVPDYGWQQQPVREDGKLAWEPKQFGVMSHSTMSYATADVNNDGNFELFSTDMLPTTTDPVTLSAWKPVIDSMMDGEDGGSDEQGEPQIIANVLRQLSGQEASVDLAPEMGIHASGWSWSGKFGDLNQDGFLDLYIVNGMVEATTFAHLPNHELREENQAFRNLNGTDFTPAPEWALNSIGSGRGMSMADLDRDGDLDIVVNNLRGPSQLFENQLCEGSSLLVDLRWSGSDNTRALGSLVTLHTSNGSYQRRVEAASGYLSGDPSQIHFGFADDAVLLSLEILWPDGEFSEVEWLVPDIQLEIVR